MPRDNLGQAWVFCHVRSLVGHMSLLAGSQGGQGPQVVQVTATEQSWAALQEKRLPALQTAPLGPSRAAMVHAKSQNLHFNLSGQLSKKVCFECQEINTNS